MNGYKGRKEGAGVKFMSVYANSSNAIEAAFLLLASVLQLTVHLTRLIMLQVSDITMSHGAFLYTYKYKARCVPSWAMTINKRGCNLSILAGQAGKHYFHSSK